tara:strand:+ start:7891 stop:8133 length:243 start_codon:yes stop_codon:yes gene_type:complete
MYDQEDYKEIAEDCRVYAQRYNCNLQEALVDWEGDGPDGSFGLNREDEQIVANILKVESPQNIRIEYTDENNDPYHNHKY